MDEIPSWMNFEGLLLLTIVALASCQEGEPFLLNPGQVIITGKIHNPIDSTITLIASELTGKVTHTAKIDAAGEFRFQFEIFSAHDNYLRYGSEGAAIFLEPNDSTHLQAEGGDFKASLQYSGDQAKFNKHLKLFSIEFRKALTLEIGRGNKSHLTPREYKDFSFAFYDRMNKIIDSLASTIQPHSGRPKAWLHTFLRYRQAEDLLEFGQENPTELGDNYFDFVRNCIEPNQHALTCSQYYDDFINNYHMKELGQSMEYDILTENLRQRSPKGLEEMIDFIDRHESNKIAKQIMVTKLLYEALEENSPVTDSIFDKYSQVVTDVTCQNFILDRLEVQKTKSQPILLLSELENLDHVGAIFKEIQERHKGKVLYVDFWGTWCRPCLDAFPQINNLNKELNPKKIGFVFLCVNSSKQYWEKTRDDYELPGTHYLLTNDQYAVLSEQFNIRGLPRYVIIDREGNVANVNAPAPNDSKLKDELRDLLNK